MLHFIVQMLSYFKLADFVRTMQNERIAMGFRVFLGKDRKDKAEDLSEIFTKTDDALAAITWKRFGKEKIFRSKLRFQLNLRRPSRTGCKSLARAMMAPRSTCKCGQSCRPRACRHGPGLCGSRGISPCSARPSPWASRSP